MHRDQVFRLLDRVLQREANIRIRRIERPAVIRSAFDLSRLKGDIGHASEFAVLHAQAVVAALLQSFDIRLRPGMLQRVPERVELSPIRLLNRQIDGLRLLWVCKNSRGQIVIGEPEADLSAANRRPPIRIAAGKVAQLATIEDIEFAIRCMVHDQRIALFVDHLAVAEPLLERLAVLQREFASFLSGQVSSISFASSSAALSLSSPILPLSFSENFGPFSPTSPALNPNFSRSIGPP